ncbi:purple acid phosphatase family protein [Singulisphaera acidiphila]|uniref:Putative phosphohydrolase n=1 Tax=Singulisphaera acidiphila (strain ATCC BAA-1392 / DSM 18658 / VKM B-2454 / MOB10) TaxID=886293 RepID=L0DEH2_SINAD|nr:metallophosphoesterase family protein [Singulisphaera acidiphila]AGA27223.1 putative phosphohydrolase [Singulisphaera acidiphila DSM 18658]
MAQLQNQVCFFATILLTGLITGCDHRSPVPPAATPKETLSAVGQRLSRSRSLDDLTTIASNGSRLLAELTPAERDALGRGHIQVEIDRPAIVEVAASPATLPFWLSDQGFARTEDSLDVQGERWSLYRKQVEAGVVGLGVNALDRAGGEHYVAFFRAADGDPISVRVQRPDRWQTAKATEGVSAALDALVPIQRLPVHLQGSILLQVPRELRHATALARGRIWKTHVASSRTPDQVAVSFGPNPARDLVWTWRTEPGVDSTALRLAPASSRGDGPADPNVIRQVAGESHLVRSPDLLNDPAIRRHQVHVDQLEPATSYVYSAGDGSPEGWTPWRPIRTGPERPDRFQFFYLGDAQCGFEGWGRLLDAAHQRHPDAGFMLLAGDLVDRGNERTNWDHFFLRAKGVFDTLPLMPCVGNHEYLDQGPQLYTSFFALPKNGPPEIDPNLVYSFEYGNAFVAVLDSNLALVDRRLAQIQAEWLDAALTKTQAAWTFVVFHHPIYASHPSRLNPTLGEDWIPVFDKHHVDFVLQGHDHAYLRTHPMRGNQRVASNAEGTTYVVSVSGEKFCEQDPRSYTELGLTHVSTYQTIDIEVPANRLLYRAWNLKGQEVDRLVIQKRSRLALGNQ